MDKLKLYVWDGVLTDYSSGIVFALAESPKAAIKMLLAKGLGDHHVKGTMIDGVKPKMYRRPVCRFVHGGG
jgi:hypothetical protein